MRHTKSGQSTFEYLILTAVILVVIVPLLFFSTTRIDTNRVAELQDALNALQEGVTQVNNLGYGTSSVVIVRVPKGVTEQRVGISTYSSTTLPGQAGVLQYRVAGSDLYTRVSADVEGILPTNEGLHHIQLFNNGTNVLLYECGNNRREAFEQCDGSENSACGTELGCAGPSHPQACNCFCFAHEDCRASTGLCDLTRNVCVPCSTNSQCSKNKVCLSGQCVDPTIQCYTNADCGYPLSAASGALVCNRQSGRCEPCDVPPLNPPYKDCNPGHTCQTPGGGVASYCGFPPGSGSNSPPVVSAGTDQQITLPSTLPLLGSVDDDGLPNGVVTTQWSTLSGPQPVIFTPAIGSYATPGLSTVFSSAVFSQAGIYRIGLQGHDGQLSASHGIQVTVLCSSNTHCSSGQTCTNGQCIGGGGGNISDCGNGILETGETCEFNPTTGAILSNSCPSSQRCSTTSCTCVNSSNAYCGDRNINSPLEECDSGQGNFNTQGTCVSGEVCTAGCLCQSANDFCGDGQVSLQVGREQCDPALGPTGGCGFGVVCTPWCSCRLLNPGFCGDGQYNGFSEECEPGVMGCPGAKVCGADCRCYGGPGGPPPPPGRGSGGGNYQPPCAPVDNQGGGCLESYCDGECPPVTYCLYDASSSNGCSCQPNPNALCQRLNGKSCVKDEDCGNITGPNRYYCGSDNCCNPYTGASAVNTNNQL